MGTFITSIQGYVGPLTTIILIFIIILIFKRPISKILNNIAQRTDTTKIRLGDFEWTFYGLDQVVLEREKLRMALMMAAADGQFLESELRHIANMAFGMKSNLDKLNDDEKISILDDALITAASDGIFSMSEFSVIAQRLREFKFPEDMLYPKIKDLLKTKRCKLDDELKKYLESKIVL